MSPESPMADTASNDALDHFRSGDLTVGVVGLGYVGLPLSVEIARAGLCAVGFDINPEVVDGIRKNGIRFRSVTLKGFRCTISSVRFPPIILSC